MITAVDCTIARFNANTLLPAFFIYYSQSEEYLHAIDRETTGATRKRISRNRLGETKIPVPPLPEQMRIVAILDEAFEAISAAAANAKKNLASARELFESCLEVAFHPPHGWPQSTVGKLADHTLGKMLDKQKNKGTLKPYLRNLNVRWFEFDLNHLLEMRFEDTEHERYVVTKGDLLICEGGYPGRAAIWASDTEIYIQKAIHRVRVRRHEHAKWLLYYLYLEDVAGRLRAHFSGTGIQHFTGESLDKFPIPVPATNVIDRQIQQFDSLFDLTRNLEEVHRQKLARLQELKQNMLERAFSGELTAPAAKPLHDAAA